MKTINDAGYLYRLSDRRYQQLLGYIAREEPYDLQQLGKAAGSIDLTITDMSPREAADTLAWLRDRDTRKDTKETTP